MDNTKSSPTQELVAAMTLKLVELCIAHSDKAMTAALRPLMDAYKVALAEEQEAERRQQLAHCGTSRHFSGGINHAGHD